MRQIVLLLAAAAVGTLAVPLDLTTSKKCAKECSGANNKFNYISGRSYEYRYETETKVELVGPSGTNTFTGFDATVTITALSQCEYLIQLSRVNFRGNKPDTELVTQLQLHPTRFSFDDGKIEHICPEANEPAWVTNVKRGVLSTFQHAFEGADAEGHVFETDISGKCPTTYETRAEGADAQVVTKTKNLMSCAHHHKKITGLRGVSYVSESQSEVKNMPLVNSKQTCRLTTRRQIMNEAFCTETHMLNPVKKDQAGVTSTTTQKLQFVSDKHADSVAAEIVQSRKSLHFDDSDIVRADVAEAQKKVTDLLKKLCDLTTMYGDEAMPETPQNFMQLVHNLRKLPKTELQAMYNNALAGSVCPKQKDIFLDALPMVGTEASVSVLVESIRNGQYPHKWLTSLSLIPKVTKAMVTDVTSLIRVVKPEGYLGISSLISSYCHSHPSCTEDAEVQAAHAQFLEKARVFCSGTLESSERHAGLLALKALGNIQRFPVNELLQNCGKTTGDRVAALMAMRRAPCDSKAPILSRIFTNVAEKTEIRLTAFMGLMPCASQEVVTTVVAQLETEKNNQVASFVYSYLAEVRRSTDPEKQELKALIMAARPRRVDKDSRKFSRYYEVSQFWDSVNLGAHAESGLIFAPESFTPRQAFLNLTVDLFGTSVNFLELGARMEGFDDLLAKMFGRHGFFSDTVNYLMREKDRERKQHSNPKIKELDDQTNSVVRDENFDASVYLRMFGDDLYHFGIQDSNPMGTVEEKTNIMSILKELITKKELKFNRNLMFLDSNLLIPTVSGLPLKLGLSGSAAINVEAAAKFDMGGRNRNTEILGVLRPSAAIRVVTKMGIHTGKHVSGIVLVSRLRHSTSQEIQITIKEQSKFHMKIDVPKDRSEILDIQSELFSSQDGEWREEKGVQEHRVSGKLCSPESLGKVFGLKLCTEISYPNASHIAGPPYFPFTGPSRLSVNIVKSDPTLQSYEVNAAFTPSREKTTGKLSFNTPGSTFDREVSGNFEFSNGFKKVKVELKSPWKLSKFDGDFERTFERDGYDINGKMMATIGSDRVYEISTNLKKKQIADDHRISYDWKADVMTPEKEAKSFSGRYETSRSGSMLADIKLINVYETPIVFTVSHDVNRESRQVKIRSNTELQVPWYHLNGHMDLDYDKVCGADCEVTKKISIKYRNPKIQAEPNTILWSTSGSWKTDPATGQKVGKLTSSHELSKYPERNGVLKYESIKTSGLFKEKFEFVFGNDLTSQVNRLTVNVLSKRAEGSWDRNYEIGVKFPPKQIDHKVALNYEGTPAGHAPSFRLTFDVQTAQGAKALDGLLRLTRPSLTEEFFKAEGELTLKCSSRNVDIRLYKSLVEKSQMEFKSLAMVQWQTDKKLEVDSDVKVKKTNDPNFGELEVLSEARMTDYPPLSMNYKLKMSPSQFHYVSQSKHGETTLHDFKLHVTNGDGDKTQIEARALLGGSIPLDWALDATYQKQSRIRKTDFTIKKQGQVFAKGDLVLPVFSKELFDTYEMSGNVHWDISEEEKVVGFIYKSHPEDKSKTHMLTLRTKFSPEADYKIHSRCSWQSKFHAMQNFTLLKNEQETLKFNLGYLLSFRNSMVDLMLKTQESMGDRHVSALALYDGENFDNFHSEGMVKNHIGGKKYTYSLTNSRTEGSNGKQKKMEISVKTPEGRLSSTLNYDKTMTGDDTNRHIVINIIYGNPSEDTTQKTLTYDLTLKNNKNTMAFGFDSKLSTPFERLSKLQALLDWSKVENRHNHKAKLIWNENKSLGASMEGTLGWHSTQMVVSFETPYERLQRVQVTTVHSLEVADVKLNWNDANYVRVAREKRSVDRDSAEQKVTFELHVPGRADWNIRASTVLSDTKYQVSGNAEFDGRTYAISGQFDKGATTALIKLETPTISSRQIEVNCPSGENCKGKWMKSDQSRISVDLKWTQVGDNGKVYSLTIKDIPNPFKVEYKYIHGEQEVNFNVLFVADLNRPEDNTYQLSFDVNRNPTSDERKFRLKYPARTISATMSRTMQYPTNSAISLKLNLNEGNPSHLIGFDYSLKRPSNVEIAVDMSVKCPMMENALSLSYLWRNRGDLRFADYFTQLRMGYSADQTKDLKITCQMTRSPGNSNRNYIVTLERPASNLLMTIDHGSDDLAKAMHMKIQFKNTEGKTLGYGFNWESPTDKPTKFELSTGEDSWSAECRADRAKNEKPVVLSKNGVELYKLVFKIDSDNQLVRADVTDLRNSRTVFHVSGRILERNGLSLRAYHTDESQQKVEDMEVTVKTAEDNMLKSTFVLRPEIRTEVQNWLTKTTDTNKNGVPQMPYRLRDFATVVIETQRQIVEDLSTACRPGLEGTVKELKAIRKEMTPSQASLQGTFGETYKYASEMMSDITSFWIITVDDLVSALSAESWKQYYTDMQTQLNTISDNFLETYRNTQQSTLDLLKSLTETFYRVTNQMRETKNRFVKFAETNWGVKELREYMEDAMKNIQESQFVTNVKSYFKNMRSSGPSGYDVQAVKNYFSFTVDWIKDFSTEFGSRTTAYYHTVYNQMLQNEDLQPFIEFLNTIGEKIKWTYNYYNPQGRVKSVMDWANEETNKLGLTSTADWKQYVPRVKVNDPSIGRYEMETKMIPMVGMPGAENFKKMFTSVADLPAMKKIMDSWKDQLTADMQDFQDWVDDMVVSQTRKSEDAMPPFDSFAMLVGDRHFVTFDKTGYDFAGECSYLLTRDFKNGLFTITVNYERQSGKLKRKSVSVHVEDEIVEIFTGGKVMVNNDEVELPEYSEENERSIVRKEDKVVLKYEGLLKVKCDILNNICTIKIDGYRHADAAGMLGVNDNEWSNDITLPDGSDSTAQLDNFASRWSVSSSCSARNEVELERNRVVPDEVQDQCRQYFVDKSSPLRGCFKHVPTEPYVTMCETELLTSSERPVNHGLCTILAAYSYACKHEGVDIQVPKECVSCSIDFKSVQEDDHVNLETIPSIADIVFIVEEKKCMNVENLAQRLQDLAQTVANKLTELEPSITTKFGLVGFNGPNVHSRPHIHTGSGLVNFDLLLLKRAASQLQYRPANIKGDTNVSPMSAIYFTAAHYPFRTGAKKVAVMLKCSSCDDSTEDFYDVQNKVLERGMTLHVLQEEEIEVTGGTEEYIGIDARSVYTIADITNVENRPEIRKKVVRPHDACSVLAQESNGTVFHLTPFTRAFTQVFAQRVSETTQPHSCQVCECQNAGNQPKTVCYPCGVPRPLSLLTSDSFFNIHYIKPLRELQQKAMKIGQDVFYN